MKQFQALIAALIVTGLVGSGIIIIGITALVNQNTVPVTDSPSTDQTIISSDTSQVQIIQLHNQIEQYQTSLNQATLQLNQANAQLKHDQAIIAELQRRGIIRILSDGTVQIRDMER